ncbi:hypothetical protein ACFFX0_11105 [Citricoccus parietis]|uniref:Uncharacterized protein n=1 Tax=Citricoccus parietis TaxID=592307 RepID=A0ABV5FYG1_9MICC
MVPYVSPEVHFVMPPVVSGGISVWHSVWPSNSGGPRCCGPVGECTEVKTVCGRIPLGRLEHLKYRNR